MKKVLFTLFAMLFVIAISCKKDDPKPAPSGNDNQKEQQDPPGQQDPPTEQKVEVTGVTLNKATLTLGIGVEETLTATIIPENATDKTITWSSSDETIATVDGSGKVKAVAEGEATITATTANGKTAICTVTTIIQEYTIGEVTKAINSAAYYYDEGKDGYTIHLLEDKNLVFTDDDEDSSTYYHSSYTAFSIDIAGSAIGIKCDFKSDGDILNNDKWWFYLFTFDSDGNEEYIYDFDLDGSILVNLTEDGTLTIELDAIGTDGVVYKAKCSIKAIAVKYYLCPVV